MKKHCLLLAIAMVMIIPVSCAQHSMHELDWLVGKWNRTNTKPGHAGFEYWEKISETELCGKGINLKGADTVFVEKLKIILKDNQLYYVADVPENKSEVLFRVTAITDSGFVCENPQHDFPKKIAYTLEGEKLTASISGNGKQIDYFFESAK
jgi:hypothetical protein